ncbi:hypothetical protein HZA26_02365 [Candidatus Nomurabacteria bacterium]|nr:hypothetical protein [Candidatus Nomurabacteria bacterium]
MLEEVPMGLDLNATRQRMATIRATLVAENERLQHARPVDIPAIRKKIDRLSAELTSLERILPTGY